jgi:hypothetical protein
VLGSSGIAVSAIGLGCMSLSGIYGSSGDDEPPIREPPMFEPPTPDNGDKFDKGGALAPPPPLCTTRTLCHYDDGECYRLEYMSRFPDRCRPSCEKRCE